MSNKNNSVLYTGVTTDLEARVDQHKCKKHSDSFTAKYNICKLVWFETLDSISIAIKREKQIKAGPRRRKIDLINSINPGWNDLSNLLQ